MAADNQGNDLNAVKNVLTSKIIVAPYVAGKTLTASQIAPSVADPITELGDVFGSSSAAVGLITSDGAPQDSRDGDDATEFHQPGYTLNADPTLTLAFTAAEDNDLTRLMTIGKPDETIVLTDVGPNGETNYYRDENDVHYVPKRSLDDLIINR